MSSLHFRGIWLIFQLKNWFVSDFMKIFHSETALQHACMYCLHTAVGVVYYGTLNILSIIDTLLHYFSLGGG